MIINPETSSALWFEGLGPFLVSSIEQDEEYTLQPNVRRTITKVKLWLDLTNLDGSRCAKQFAGTDADADDCRKDMFLTEARRANVAKV